MSQASAQRNREYIDWATNLPDPVRDDEVRDDSEAEWRRQREMARLKRLTETRRQQRTPSAAMLQRENDFSDWLRDHPDHVDSDRADVWPIFMRDRVRRREEARRGGTRGRPVNPNSKRQRLLAARAEHGSHYTLSMLLGNDPDWQAAQQRRLQEAEWIQEYRAQRWHKRELERGRSVARLDLEAEARTVDTRLGTLAGAERHREAEVQWRAAARRHADCVHPRKRRHEADRAEAAAREKAANANAEAAAAAAAAADDTGAVEAEALTVAQAAATQASAAAAAVTSAARVAKARRRRHDPEDFWALAGAALKAAGAAGTESLRAALALAAAPVERSTVGQCEGVTRLGERCRVHKSSKYAAAGPLRRGERYCEHHDPKKYTGVRCAGVRKKGRGQCNVWSGSSYADAAPLRAGSKFCRHHQVRCAGITQAGARCGVTSSSEHAHAEPLRQGELFCMHHRVAEPGDASACEGCGELCGDGSSLCGECQDLHTWQDVERARTWRLEHPVGCACGGVVVRGRGDMDMSEAWCDGCDWLNIGL